MTSNEQSPARKCSCQSSIAIATQGVEPCPCGYGPMSGAGGPQEGGCVCIAKCGASCPVKSAEPAAVRPPQSPSPPARLCGQASAPPGTAQPTNALARDHGATVPNGPRFRLRVLRSRCKDCIGGSQKATRCDDTDCPLWDYRTGHRPKGYKAKRTPLCALRAYCVWCCDGSYQEVRLCPVRSCPLWPWRMGRATGQRRDAAQPDAKGQSETGMASAEGES